MVDVLPDGHVPVSVRVSTSVIMITITTTVSVTATLISSGQSPLLVPVIGRKLGHVT